jgi:hypothetical protein
MRLRAYIKKPATDYSETLSSFDAAASRIGSISSRVVAPYWKIDSLDEVVWIIVLTQQPASALAALLREIGSGWQHSEDGASLDCRFGGASLPGVSSIFVDVEYLDWGRHHGTLPRFEFHQRVRICDDQSGHTGSLGSVCGHAFDRDTCAWSYSVLLDVDERVHDFPEAELNAVSTP